MQASPCTIMHMYFESKKSCNHEDEHDGIGNQSKDDSSVAKGCNHFYKCINWCDTIIKKPWNDNEKWMKQHDRNEKVPYNSMNGYNINHSYLLHQFVI